ncbi:MAG: amino acid adenylation domain-containing protein, partial [Acidobacteriota bacterium]
ELPLGSCGAVSAVTVHPENLAYVIYTSGSTGRPKGVLVEHRSVANLSVVLADAIDDGLAGKGPLRVAVNAPLAFDASIKQVIQLLAGSTLVLIPEAVRADGQALVTILDRERVDVFDCTPSQLRLMLAAGLCEDEGPAFPQRVLLGGEPIDGSSWEQLAGDRRSYFNVYGPTECTVDTTARRITAETAPSLGHPLANIRVEILDARLRRLPLGMAGELCIGGAGVARGYLARAGLTAACFVPDAFAREHEPGSRIYRSGDQARFGAQGEIEFIGRLDGQVKLRGVRLELGEIDFALTRHPGVAEAVTVVRDDPPIGQRLVGYVTPVRPGESAEERPEANPSHPDPSAHDEELSSEGLRGFLRRTLPEVMVPTNVVILDQLPLTVNGKIDRAALPAPEAEERPIQEARTPSEELLVGIWSELLGRERVGTEDNFFELGGHSLLATQVTSRVRSVFGVELPLRVLFEHPTVAGLAVELDAASRAESGVVAPPIERLGRETAPLSFAQQRLWFIDQMEPGSPKYNLPSALRLTRELRIDALAATFSEIVRRHETLRTSFPTVDGKSVQVIAPPAPVPLPVIDLEGLDEERRDAEAQRWAAAASNRPFDLQRGPVLRLAILRLAAADHVLLLTMHHIAGDGWSMEILIREVSTLYAAFVAGRPSPLPELQFQYADYAVWQRQWLSGEVLKAEVEHWRSRLAGAPPVLELPSDRPRPAVASYGGASLPLRISDELMASLSALCQREGVTLFMLLLAVYQALLSRWSGQTDISVGTAIAGRNREETEGLIGFFVNTLVLRLRLDEDLEVRSLLRKVREETLEAQAHQELPFEKLVEELQPNRNLSHTPLFQVTFGFQRTMSEEVVETMSGIRPIVIPRNSAKFELAMALRQQSGRLSGGLSYATDLFDHTTILRMSEHYVALLGNLADSLESRFLDLEILSPGERFQLVVDCNDTRAEAPLSRSITALFDERVANAPEAVAVIFEGETLTYGMLARRAEALAHRLRAAGVGRGDFVALYAERSPSLLIALLAILETGSAYVPLDPGDPPERLAAILRELGSPFLLSAPEGIDQLPSGGFRPLPLDAAPTAIEGASPPAQRVEVTGDDAAYVIFTSGSTGRPKGVAVPHHAVIRLVRGADYVQLGVGSRVAQASVATFDAATFEIWGALLNGGALVGVPKEKLLTASSLSTEIRRQRIDTLFVTTALFNQLVAEEPGVFSELENLLFGGEAVDPKRVSEAQASRPPRRLLHVYGPTETTTFATWYRASSAARRQRTLPIGWPIANSSSYVLDRGLRPVPIGVVGELLLGGEGLSWGYWGRPGLSASRYVPDLFGAPGSRLYRSGDLVRSTVEGAVEFVGRVDHQVKLRGFRIEMGEIEAVLSTHPWVRETVVVLRHDPPAPKRLIAYWAGAGTSAVDEGRLRDFLVPKLP